MEPYEPMRQKRLTQEDFHITERQAVSTSFDVIFQTKRNKIDIICF